MSFNVTRSPRRRHEAATASFDAGEELEDLGLSRQFYDTQFDFPKFQADEYADKFLLGVSVRMRRPLYLRALHPVLACWGAVRVLHERCASTARAGLRLLRC